MNIQNPLILDYLGNQFPIKQYTRIISLVPSLTELLFSFKLENSIIGVTKYCTFPSHARDKPRTIIGGTKNLNIQEIFDLKPDIVLINQEENQIKHYTQLVTLKIPVFVTFPKNVNEALKLFHDLHTLFLVQSLEDLTKLDQLAKYIANKVSFMPLINRKKVFCPIWKDPWMVFNSDTYASSIIEFCGGVNVFANNHNRYPKIDLGTIIESEPDIILLPDEPYHFGESDKQELLKIFTTTNNIPNIILISGTFHWYSVNMMKQALDTLNKLLT